jgi:hypothetical protein
MTRDDLSSEVKKLCEYVERTEKTDAFQVMIVMIIIMFV